MDGFTGGRHKEDEHKGEKVLKMLLCAARYRKGRSDTNPAVLLHFTVPTWDLKARRGKGKGHEDGKERRARKGREGGRGAEGNEERVRGGVGGGGGGGVEHIEL